MLIIVSFSLLLFNSLFRNKSKYLLSFIIICTLIYAAGFRTSGFDYVNYKNGFEWNSFREPIFKGLVTFLHTIHAPFQCFLLIVATVTVLITYTFLLKSDNEIYWLSLLIFVSNYYIQHDYIQIRIGLACSIFLFQLYYISIGEKKKALFLWALACCCHFSMVIAGISFFVSNKRIKKIEIYLIVIIFAFSFLLGLKGLSLVSLAEHIPGISFYYKLYKAAIENGEGAAIKVYNPLYLTRYVVFFFCLLKKKLLEKRNPNICFYLRLYFLGILFFLLFTGIPAFAFRGSEIFFIIELIMFPSIRFIFRNKNVGNIAVVFLALIFFGINVLHNHLLGF